MGNTAQFGIGVFQSLSGGITIGSGWPTQHFQLAQPYSGVYGGTYGFLLDTTIRAPTQVTYTPPTAIGLDGTGVPVVRGYPILTWNYSVLRPDYWYQLMNLYARSGNADPFYQYIVLLQYPDPLGSGSLTQALARMDPPTHSARAVGHYADIQLKFTYVTPTTPEVPVVVLV